MTYAKWMVAAACVAASMGMAKVDAQSLGFFTLSASVSVNGGTIFGSGIASSSHLATGIYAVVFSRDVSQCATVATLNGNLGGQVSVAPVPSHPTQIRVNTFSKTGVATNSAFAIIATCSSGT